MENKETTPASQPAAAPAARPMGAPPMHRESAGPRRPGGRRWTFSTPGQCPAFFYRTEGYTSRKPRLPFRSSGEP